MIFFSIFRAVNIMNSYCFFSGHFYCSNISRKAKKEFLNVVIFHEKSRKNAPI